MFAEQFNTLLTIKLQSYGYLTRTAVKSDCNLLNATAKEMADINYSQMINLMEMVKIKDIDLKHSVGSSESQLFGQILWTRVPHSSIEFDSIVVNNLLLLESVEMATLLLLIPSCKLLGHDDLLLAEMLDNINQNREILTGLFKQRLRVLAD
jgi:hypothetical protein